MDTEDALAAPDLLTALRRSWYAALAVVVGCAVLGALLAGLFTPTATATASLVVSDPRADSLYGDGGSDQNYVANQVALLQLRSTSAAAIPLLPSAGAQAALDAETLSEDLEVETPGESGLITVSYTSPSPELAQQAVNAVVEAYQSVLAARAAEQQQQTLASIDAAVTALDAQIAARAGTPVDSLVASRDQLLQRRVEVAVDAGTGDGVLVTDPAPLPEASRPLSRTAGALLGALLGALPATALAYVLALRARRFSTRFEPEALLGERLLSDVPVFTAERLPSDVPALDAPDSAAAEAFRFAATLLAVRQADLESTVHAVVSAASQDGKTTVSANLAVTAALAGRRVLAIDGDLDGRGLSFLLLGGAPAGSGLTDVAEGRADLADVVTTAPLPGGRSLDVLTGGGRRDGLGELFSGAGMRAALARAARTYDLVVLDAPPVLQVAYAAGLVRAADAVVVVVPHASAESGVTDLAERLDFLQVPVLGYVYNKAPLRTELGQHSRLVTDSRRRPTEKGDTPVPARPVPPVPAHSAGAPEARPTGAPLPGGRSA